MSRGKHTGGLFSPWASAKLPVQGIQARAEQNRELVAVPSGWEGRNTDFCAPEEPVEDPR